MPLAIDLFCGLGGWSDGLLAEGWDVLGFDIEQHEYAVPDVPEGAAQKNTGGSWFAIGGPGQKVTKRNPDRRNWAKDAPRTKLLRYPGQLVLQDVLTLHGSQFKDADLIVASPPCQEYSYMAMPWKRAKQIAAALRGKVEFPEGYAGSRTVEELNALFNACFRIKREASEAAKRDIPLIVENVRGAIPWVGRSRWNFGSFYLWGDVPALMPRTMNAHKVPSFRFDGSGGSFQSASVRRTDVGNGVRFTSRDCGIEGIKQSGISGPRNNGKGDRWFQDGAATHGSRSSARKAASAMIAKIPTPLARHIGASFYPMAKAA